MRDRARKKRRRELYGNEIGREIGAALAIGSENTQEDEAHCECITMNL